MKIVAITPVSGPYMVARYSAFAKTFPDVSLFLLELGESSLNYQWKHPNVETLYTRVILSKTPVQLQSSWELFHNIKSSLDKLNPDVVILCGYGVRGMLQGLICCVFGGYPTVLLSATKEDDAPRFWLTEWLKSFLLKTYKSALVGGMVHKQYLIQRGMKPDSIFLGYNVVGNDTFQPQSIYSLTSPHHKPFFLAINRFIPKKNLPFLLSAYYNYREIFGESAWDLILCGDGELKPLIEQQIQELQLTQSVILPGFLQENELLPYFAHAKFFVHASIQEQWGLVINEAMAAGLPVLVSNKCGCFDDLVIEGVNGFGFDPTNQVQLTQLMIKMSSDEVDLNQMGQASLNHIQKYSPSYFAQGLMKAVNYALVNS